MEIRITESKRQSKTAYGKQLSGILLETALIWLSAGGGLLLFMSVLTEQERMAPILEACFLWPCFARLQKEWENMGFMDGWDWEWFPSQGSSCSMDSS